MEFFYLVFGYLAGVFSCLIPFYFLYTWIRSYTIEMTKQLYENHNILYETYLRTLEFKSAFPGQPPDFDDGDDSGPTRF